MQAIVSGHTRGLGQALCAELLERDVRVLGLARGENTSLNERWPGRVTQVQLDLGDFVALQAFIVSDQFTEFLSGDQPALLINNAGLLQPIHPLGGQGAEAIARAVDVNIAAPMILADAFVAATAHSADRRIVHVSSGAAHQAYAGWGVYCASKAALDHHARVMHAEQAPRLRTESVAPGVIDTGMQAEIRASDASDFPQIEKFEALHREGQLLSPEDCARRLVEHLLSPQFGEQACVDLRDF